MKLTDEQREEILKTLRRYQEIMADRELITTQTHGSGPLLKLMYELKHITDAFPEHISTLLSSEQAWKAEAERLKGQMDIYKRMNGKFENTFHELRTQLNQAIEALKRLLDNNQLRTGEDAKEARIEIMYILTSLSQGTEVSHEK